MCESRRRAGRGCQASASASACWEIWGQSLEVVRNAHTKSRCVPLNALHVVFLQVLPGACQAACERVDAAEGNASGGTHFGRRPCCTCRAHTRAHARWARGRYASGKRAVGGVCQGKALDLPGASRPGKWSSVPHPGLRRRLGLLIALPVCVPAHRGGITAQRTCIDVGGVPPRESIPVGALLNGIGLPEAYPTPFWFCCCRTPVSCGRTRMSGLAAELQVSGVAPASKWNHRDASRFRVAAANTGGSLPGVDHPTDFQHSEPLQCG